jgi:hypothetical protein
MDQPTMHPGSSFEKAGPPTTVDRLARRGLQHHHRCLLRDQAPETIHHPIIGCPNSHQIWLEILSWLHLSCTTSSDHGMEKHPQANAQTTSDHGDVSVLDDLQTPQRLRIRRAVTFHLQHVYENQR